MSLERGLRHTASWLGLWVVSCMVVLATVASADSEEIRVGLSAAMSGPAKSLGRKMRLGIEIYFERINAAGGIDGRNLSLIALDDGYIPEVAARNMHRLIDEENVVAVLGNVGTPTAAVTVPIANEKRTLLFGAFTGAGLLRKSPPDRYVINYRASYEQETEAMIGRLLEAGVRPYQIAFFSQRDSYGDAGYQGALQALRDQGYNDPERLPHGRYERNTVEIDDGLMTILSSPIAPRAIIMIGAYAPCAKFIRIARRALPSTLFLNVSFVGSMALKEALGPHGEGVIVSQVVPPFAQKLPITSAYNTDLAKFAPNVNPSFVSLEGYIVARIFVEGLRKARRPLTRESVVDGILALDGLDIGLDAPIHFGPKQHQASDSVWLTQIDKKNEFVPVDWEAIATSLRESLSYAP
jgi:branched-chain amino acid transport system substrate-binding protein